MPTSSKKTNTVILEAEIPEEDCVPESNQKLTRQRILANLRLLWRRREFLRRWALAGFVASVLVAFTIPKEYISTAQLMPPDSQSGAGLAMVAALAGQNGSGLSSVAGDLLGVKTTGALFIAVMRSRTVEDRIVQGFDLKKVYWTRLQESARQRLEMNTSISEDRKSGVITLRVTDRNPNRAASIAGAYVSELDNLMAELNTSSAQRERIFLEERLSTIKVELESSEKDFSQFASKNAAIDITVQGKAMLEGAATLQGELIASESELQGLRQIYSDNNVRVRSTQARINELRNQQSKLGGKYNATGSGNTDPSEGGSYPTLRQLPILGVPYADKFRQLKVEEAVFETLTKEYELAKVQEAKEIPSVKVLDSPEVPEHKSYPPRMLIIIAGTLCAFILATIWIFGATRWGQIDAQDPSLIFAQEIFETFRSRIPWAFAKNSAPSERPSNCSDQIDNTNSAPPMRS
jgi:capsule polysaccharide export protein KpsE/RkpR